MSIDKVLKEFDEKFEYVGIALDWYTNALYVKNNKPGFVHLQDIKDFIHTQIKKAEQRGQSKVGQIKREAYQLGYKEGVVVAYKTFLNIIKGSKAKLPGRNEFELVVDVRDIEKSLSYLEGGL